MLYKNVTKSTLLKILLNTMNRIKTSLTGLTNKNKNSIIQIGIEWCL